MASLQLTKPQIQEPQMGIINTKRILGNAKETCGWSPEKVVVPPQQEEKWVVKKVKDERKEEEFKALEEDHIEQMIEELVHYGTIELCSVLPPQANVM